VPGISRRLAEQIHAGLHGIAPPGGAAGEPGKVDG